MGDLRGDEGVGGAEPTGKTVCCRHERVDGHRSEDPLVDEIDPEFAVRRVVDVEADAQQPVPGRAGLPEEDLTAHAQVDDDGPAGVVRSPRAEWDPDEFAAPGGRAHHASGEECGEIAGGAVMTP